MHKRKRANLEPVVQPTHKGQQFTFRVDPMPPLAFWRVESEGRIYRSSMRVVGDEQPAFFGELADAALRD